MKPCHIQPRTPSPPLLRFPPGTPYDSGIAENSAWRTVDDDDEDDDDDDDDDGGGGGDGDGDGEEEKEDGTVGSCGTP